MTKAYSDQLAGFVYSPPVIVLTGGNYTSKVKTFNIPGKYIIPALNTGMDTGHSITSCCGEGFVVAGGFDGDPVAWSDDGGESWNTTDDVPDDGEVHVACDPVCDNIVYAATDDGDGGSIYRTDLTDGGWDNLTPVTAPYTGVVVANEGTLYAATNWLQWDSEAPVCHPDRFGSGGMDTSGVARNLTPCETPCCGDESWDYLVCGLNDQEESGEFFNAQPTSLRICGCLSTDTNSVLWAIDTDYYDVENGSGSDDDYGQLWSYEDCAAKVGPTLLSPADGDVLDCAPCAGCDPSTFTMSWEGMCD
ncbi:WD40/YVTN/BNR-like repeat-containing protein, partial [Chloroflexota bacterium]